MRLALVGPPRDTSRLHRALLLCGLHPNVPVQQVPDGAPVDPRTVLTLRIVLSARQSAVTARCADEGVTVVSVYEGKQPKGWLGPTAQALVAAFPTLCQPPEAPSLGENALAFAEQVCAGVDLLLGTDPAPGGVLYVLRGASSERVKVGVTEGRGESRLRTLQASSGEEMRLRALLRTRDNRLIESFLHTALTPWRAWNEWYDPTPVVLHVVAHLAGRTHRQDLTEGRHVLRASRSPNPRYTWDKFQGLQGILAGGVPAGAQARDSIMALLTPTDP